jgi:hypothetical protein
MLSLISRPNAIPNAIYSWVASGRRDCEISITSEARIVAPTGRGDYEMRIPGLHKRALTHEVAAPDPCPRCQAIEEMSDKEIAVRLAKDLEFLEGRRICSGSLTDLPDHSPSCPLYQKTAAISREEVDAKLAQLTDLMKKRKR